MDKKYFCKNVIFILMTNIISKDTKKHQNINLKCFAVSFVIKSINIIAGYLGI